MAYTDLELFNMALVTLGESRVAGLIGTDKRNEAYTVFFAHCLDLVQMEMNQKFATTRDELSLLSDETLPGYAYLYTYPSDCLILRSVTDVLGNKATAWDVMRYKPISNRVIACDIEDAYAEYIQDVSPSSDFTAHFIEAFRFKLAADMAIFLTDDPKKQMQCLQMYETTKAKAGGKDIMQNRAALPTTNQYTDAR
jgi:hypothetical protein